jgi:hypothetical protein
LASAQTDEERAGARALAEQGAAAYDEGRWADAVDLFTRAQSVIDAPPHLLYIARAQEKQGNLVQAMEAYIKVTRTQLEPDAPEAFVQAKADAARELDALTPRLPQVTVTVSGEKPSDDVVVKVDGEPLPAAFVGVKRPANPGKHTYSAEGKMLEAPEVTIAVAEGGVATVELVLRQKAGATAVPVAAPEPASQPAAPAQPADAGEGASGVNVPAYATLGVGVVGVGVGTLFLVKRGKKSKDADALDAECRTTRACGPSDADRLDTLDTDAAKFGTFSVVGYSVGAVGVGVGLYLLLSGTNPLASNPRDSIGVWASNDQIGVAGRF